MKKERIAMLEGSFPDLFQTALALVRKNWRGRIGPSVSPYLELARRDLYGNDPHPHRARDMIDKAREGTQSVKRDYLLDQLARLASTAGTVDIAMECVWGKLTDQGKRLAKGWWRDVSLLVPLADCIEETGEQAWANCLRETAKQI